MKLLNYLVSIRFRNCILSGSRGNVSRNYCSKKVHNECSMVSFFRILMPAYKRNFMIYAPTFCKELEFDGNLKGSQERSRTGKQKQGPHISVIDENNKETVMSLVDAEKLASRKNLKLALHKTSREDRVKYKLEKLSFTTDSEKGKKKDVKKIVLKDETQRHDVEIKINRMLKFIDQGLNVLCTIEHTGNKSEGKVLELLQESKLKDSLISLVEGKRRSLLRYGPKPDKKENVVQKEDKENVPVSE